MDRKIDSHSFRFKAAGIIVLAAAMALNLAGCSGNANNTGSTVSSTAQATPAATLPAQSEGSAAPSATPVPEAVMDTAKLQPVFGFADETGGRLLVTSQEEGKEEQLKDLNLAIGHGGQVLTVKFDRWQRGTDSSNGRESAVNFANLPGYVYTVEGGTAAADETYYLADNAAFEPDALLTVQAAAADSPQLAASDAVYKRITSLKQRDILAAWKLADLLPDRQLYLVQFVKQDQDMLFSLVLQEAGQLSFMDYPAVITDNEYSVWRVDDGGEVRPEMFALLFAARTAEGLLLGLNWLGAEGVNTFFLSKTGEGFKALDIQYGRYTSPV